MNLEVWDALPVVGLTCTLSGNKPGDTAHCSCYNNFIMEGPAELKCGTDERWNPEPPTCKPSN